MGSHPGSLRNLVSASRNRGCGLTPNRGVPDSSAGSLPSVFIFKFGFEFGFGCCCDPFCHSLATCDGSQSDPHRIAFPFRPASPRDCLTDCWCSRSRESRSLNSRPSRSVNCARTTAPLLPRQARPSFDSRARVAWSFGRPQSSAFHACMSRRRYPRSSAAVISSIAVDESQSSTYSRNAPYRSLRRGVWFACTGADSDFTPPLHSPVYYQAIRSSLPADSERPRQSLCRRGPV